MFTSTRPGYTARSGRCAWIVRAARYPTRPASRRSGRCRTTGGGEFGGRQGGARPGPTSTPTEGQELHGLDRCREGAAAAARAAAAAIAAAAATAAAVAKRRRPRRAADPNDPYTAMPPMARPPANAITLPLDPARFDGMQITDMRYKANGRGYRSEHGRAGRARRRTRRRPRRHVAARRSAAGADPDRPP